MNDLQNLGVLCAKFNECATELACLKYCDPALILKDVTSFYNNAFTVLHLHETLSVSLKDQIFFHCSPIILYVYILLNNLCKEFHSMDKALCIFQNTNDYSAYYKTIYSLETCMFHKKCEIKLINNKCIDIELLNFSHVERFLCKINVVFPLIKAADGIKICENIIDILGEFIGISSVAKYELYPFNTNCCVCYEELQIIPNNGQSVNKRLKTHICEHIAKMQSFNFCAEEYLNVLEHDLHTHSILTDEIKACLHDAKKSLLASREDYDSEAENILRNYDIFAKNIPEHIYTLSDLTYWSKTSEKILHTATLTLKQLNIYNEILKNVKQKISMFLYDHRSNDCFDIFSSMIDRQHSVFIGSLFTSLNEVTSVLAAQCLQAFENNAMFKDAKNIDPINSTMRSIITSVKENNSHVNLESYRAAHYNIGSYDVHEEVKARKKQYFNKIANIGYNKIKDSIERESKHINKLIHLNTVGNVCFEMLSKIINMFSNRAKLHSFIENGVNLLAVTHYDNHLHVRNNLSRQIIAEENRNILIQQMYFLLNGPLFDHRHDFFPLPGNIDMAYAYDNAEILPHKKEEFMQCIHASWASQEWMISAYNEFFCVKNDEDINIAQEKIWKFIKELVIAVALYNDLYGHKLQIFRIDETVPSPCGIYLTYDHEISLLLKTETNIFYGNDLYSLLYLYASH